MWLLSTNKSGSKEGPEWNEKMATGDASEVKQGVGDTGAGEDTEESNLLHELLNRIFHPLEPRQLLWVLQLLLELVKLLLLLTGFRSGESRGSRHEVRRQFSNSCARPPAKGLDSHLAEDGPDTDLSHTTRYRPSLSRLCDVGADDFSRVRRGGELQTAALVRRYGYRGNVRTEVEQEGVESRTQTYRAEDTQANPPAAPGEVFLPGV